jgi:hypothetical protein
MGMSWEALIGFAATFILNAVTLAYVVGKYSNRIDHLEHNQEKMFEDIKELRPLKGDIHAVREILQRIETQFNQLMNLRLKD